MHDVSYEAVLLYRNGVSWGVWGNPSPKKVKRTFVVKVF